MSAELHTIDPDLPTRTADQLQTYRGVPVEPNQSGEQLVARRSGWGINVDLEQRWPEANSVYKVEEHSVMPDPGRHVEHLTRDHHAVSAGDALIVRAIDPNEKVIPCTFCNPESHVDERGLIDSDLAFFKPNGNEPVAYTCITCMDS